MAKKKKMRQANEPGSQGMFYSQKKCPVCGQLIVANSPLSCQGASSNLGRKLKEHKEQCYEKQAVNAI